MNPALETSFEYLGTSQWVSCVLVCESVTIDTCFLQVSMDFVNKTLSQVSIQILINYQTNILIFFGPKYSKAPQI